jgi:hypothetical protein
MPYQPTNIYSNVLGAPNIRYINPYLQGISAQGGIQYQLQQQKSRAEAERERLRYGRFREFVDPLLSEYQSFIGGGGPQTQYDPNDPALLAMTGAIEQRGGEAQAELQSILAGSGNIRAGALGEASARRIGETEALVAGRRGEFAQAASDRAIREWEARINSYSRLIQEALGSYF